MKLTLTHAILSTSILTACGSPSPPVSSSTGVTTTSPTPTPTINQASTTPTPTTAGTHCRFTVTDRRGCEPGEVEALIEPVRPRLEACRTSSASGGKLRVRVRQVQGKLVFDIEPGSSLLDPTEKKCVLDALATIHDDGTSLSNGATVRPSGFTSILTIEW